MTKAISMAIELDQDIMVTNMCVKFGADGTNSFQELNRKQSSVRTYGQGQPYLTPLCGGIKSALQGFYLNCFVQKVLMLLSENHRAVYGCYKK